MDELYDAIIKNLQALILHPATDPAAAEILAGDVKNITALWEASLDDRVKALGPINPDPCTLDQRGLSELLRYAGRRLIAV